MSLDALSPSQAHRLLSTKATQYSQRLFQCARYCHYWLFADERGSLDALSDPLSKWVPPRLEPYAGLRAIATNTSNPSEARLLIEQLRSALDQIFPNLQAELLGRLGGFTADFTWVVLARRAMKTQINSGEAVPCKAMALYLGKLHGLGYARVDNALGSLDEWLEDWTAQAVELEHQETLDQLSEKLHELRLAGQIHPMAFISESESFEEFVRDLLPALRKKTRAHQDAGPGGPRVNMSPVVDRHLRTLYLDVRYGAEGRRIATQALADGGKDAATASKVMFGDLKAANSQSWFSFDPSLVIPVAVLDGICSLATMELDDLLHGARWLQRLCRMSVAP